MTRKKNNIPYKVTKAKNKHIVDINTSKGKSRKTPTLKPYQEYYTDSKGNKAIRTKEENVFYKVDFFKSPEIKLTKLKGSRLYDSHNFNTQTIKKAMSGLSERDIKREYARLLKIARGRYRSFEKAGVESQFVERYKKDIQGLKDINKYKRESTREKHLIKGLVSLNRFLDSDLSTVTGFKKDANKWIETMRDRGYQVDQYNYNNVIDVLEWLSTEYQGYIYDSDQIIEIAIEKANNKMVENLNSMNKRYNAKSVRSKIKNEVIKEYKGSTQEQNELTDLLRETSKELYF